MQEGIALSPGVAAGSGGAYPSDEEILGMDTAEGAASSAPAKGEGAAGANDDAGNLAHGGEERADARGNTAEAGHEAESGEAARSSADAVRDAPPEWLKPFLADEKAGPGLKSLWEQHQAYREVFPTVAEARALKELFPGGVNDAKQLQARGEDAARMDAAYFSGDTRAQAQLAEYLLRDNPRAFHAMLRQSAQVLAARDPQALEEIARGALGPGRAPLSSEAPSASSAQALRPEKARAQDDAPIAREFHRQREGLERERGAITRAREEFDRERQHFRAEQFASFRESANEAVVGQVRQSIEQTIARVLPRDVSEGARKRIADDIFNEVNTALQNDPALTPQIAGLLRQWRFDEPTRAQVVNLIYARAKSLVPTVAKRIVTDWTSSVLSANRQKTSKQQASASRVDIVGGGAPGTLGKRSLTPRDIDYSKTSDDEILSLP